MGVRLDKQTRDRVDGIVAALSTPWHEATVSDAVRAALLVGIEALEKEHKIKRPVSMADPMKKGAGK